MADGMVKAKRRASAWSTLLSRLPFGRARTSREIFSGGPKPLIDPAGRFVVYWSPKSACTTTLIWFLHAVGLEDAARAHGEWPHRFRFEVYYKTDAYERAAQAGFAGMRRIRVIRDPFDRAVSSFRHAIGTGYADPKISAFLGRRLRKDGKFSFREFLDFLESEKIDKANTHHRQQLQPIERDFPPTDVINITRQDLFTELNRIEREMGLPATDFPALAWLHATESPRRPFVASPGQEPYEMAMSRRSGLGEEPWPPTAELLTDEARRRLAVIYRADLEAYSAYL
jgi:hypothetical protein